jgi:hypothetical protein
MTVVMFALGTIALSFTPADLRAQDAMEPEALQILKRMTDYVGGLQRFSMHTENTLEDVLVNGQKIQYDFATSVIIQRPNKLHADRTAYRHRQMLVYDGKTLTIHDHQGDNYYYAATPVPDNLDDVLHFARDKLDIVPPSGDLVFTQAFELLTAGITSANVAGKAIIGGVECDHLAFTSPLVDLQIWIADGDRPLPYKYVLTTKDDPVHPQFVTLISNWNVAPELNDETFKVTPPPGAKETEFIPKGDDAR